MPGTGWRSIPIGPAAALWALAFTHRLFLMLGNIDRGWPFPIFYEGDAETFYHHAQAILAGRSYDAGVPFHPPFFPWFLSGWHALLGTPVPNTTLRAILTGIHSLQVPLLWLLLRRFLSPGAALAATLLAAYSFGLGVISSCAVSEGLYLLLLTGALLCLDHLTERPRSLRLAVLLGVLLAMMSLTRAEAIGLSLALLVLGAIWSRRRPRLGAGSDTPSARGARALGGPDHHRALEREAPGGQRRVRLRPAQGRGTSEDSPGRGWREQPVVPWLLALAALVLCIAPYSIRNAIVLGRVNEMPAQRGLPPLSTFAPITAYGPLNFALANHAGAPGYFSRSLLSSGEQTGVLSLLDPQHREYFVHGYRHGLEFIRSSPGAFLSLVVRKLAVTARALRLGWTQWNLPGGLTGERYPVDLFAPKSSLAVWVNGLLLAGGTVLLLRDRRRGGGRGGAYLALVAVLTGFAILTTAAFFGYVRQGALLLPFLYGIEGVALAALAKSMSRRFARRGAGTRGTPEAANAVEAVEAGELDRRRRAPGARAGRTAGRGGRSGFSRLGWALIAVLWLVELAGAFQGRNYNATGETIPGSQMLNRDSIMFLEPTR